MRDGRVAQVAQLDVFLLRLGTGRVGQHLGDGHRRQRRRRREREAAPTRPRCPPDRSRSPTTVAAAAGGSPRQGMPTSKLVCPAPAEVVTVDAAGLHDHRALAGSSVEKLTSRQGPATWTATSPRTGGVVSGAAASWKTPMTPGATARTAWRRRRPRRARPSRRRRAAACLQDDPGSRRRRRRPGTACRPGGDVGDRLRRPSHSTRPPAPT